MDRLSGPGSLGCSSMFSSGRLGKIAMTWARQRRCRWTKKARRQPVWHGNEPWWGPAGDPAANPDTRRGSNCGHWHPVAGAIQPHQPIGRWQLAWRKRKSSAIKHYQQHGGRRDSTNQDLRELNSGNFHAANLRTSPAIPPSQSTDFTSKDLGTAVIRNIRPSLLLPPAWREPWAAQKPENTASLGW